MTEPLNPGKPALAALAVVLILSTSPPLLGQEAAPAPADASEPGWSLELGLSYLATTGNSETSSSGLNAAFERDWDPWSLKAAAFFLRAEDEEETTAERYGANVSGAREVGERWSVTAGWQGESDRFSGIDLRSVVNGGLEWRALETASWEIDALAALTWTYEELDGEAESNDFFGALLGLGLKWTISPSADLASKLTYFPNFEDGEDYRFEGELALTASLNSRWALKVGYQLRYDNVPVEGFERTDTATTASLVLKLPGGA